MNKLVVAKGEVSRSWTRQVKGYKKYKIPVIKIDKNLIYRIKNMVHDIAVNCGWGQMVTRLIKVIVL